MHRHFRLEHQYYTAFAFKILHIQILLLNRLQPCTVSSEIDSYRICEYLAEEFKITKHTHNKVIIGQNVDIYAIKSLVNIVVAKDYKFDENVLSSGS